MNGRMHWIFIIMLMCIFAFAVSCTCGDDDSRNGKDISSDDDTDDFLDDDTADDDGDDDDDDDDDDQNFWPEDDDWFHPDDDDDADDDVDDDLDDDADDDIITIPGIVGWAVGQNYDGDQAFIGFVSEEKIMRRPLSSSDGVRLTSIDMADETFGFTVGNNLDDFEGVVIEIDDDVFTKRVTPDFEGVWGLEDVEVFSEDLAFMAGYQVVGDQLQGAILMYDGSSLSNQALPAIDGPWMLESVAVGEDYEAWAVGGNDLTDQPIILRYNGFNWSQAALPAVDDYAYLSEVSADSHFLAVALGAKSNDDEPNLRPFALTWEGSSWIQTWTFAGDGVSWEFESLDVYTGNAAQAHVIKSNHLEEWKFDGSLWQRQIFSLTLPEGGVIEANSMLDSANGLLGVRNNDGHTGGVIQKYDDQWGFIEDVPESMGCIYDVVSLRKE